MMEQRVKKLENTMKRLVKRAPKPTQFMVPPIPIFSYIHEPEADGAVFRQMTPGRYTLKKALLFVDSMPKGKVEITIQHTTLLGNKTFTSQSGRKDITIEESIELFEHDRITVYIKPIVEEETVFGIWVSLVIVPSITDAETKKVFLNEEESDS
jgi:hypothetical protein